MTLQLTTETITPIIYKNVLVITTELLAQMYGIDIIRIQQNYKRNDHRFVEGKHYFKVEGTDLKNLRLSLSESQNRQVISSKTRTLALWTERGAARHAKMLETDEAWEVFEKLEDCYFRQQPIIKPEPSTASIPHPTSLIFDMPEPCIEVKGCAVSQLNALFSTLEYISLEMWPHLRTLFPALEQKYESTFVTSRMLLSLLKDVRKNCADNVHDYSA